MITTTIETKLLLLCFPFWVVLGTPGVPQGSPIIRSGGYYGCFDSKIKERNFGELADYALFSDKMSVALCAKHCRTRSRTLCGIQGNACSCGRGFTYSTLFPFRKGDSECSVNCPVGTGTCGRGTDRWSVYQAVDRVTIDAETHDLVLWVSPSRWAYGNMHSTCEGGPKYRMMDRATIDGGANDGVVASHDVAPRYFMNVKRGEPYLQFDEKHGKGKAMTFDVSGGSGLLCGGSVTYFVVFRTPLTGTANGNVLLRGRAGSGSGGVVWETTVGAGNSVATRAGGSALPSKKLAYDSRGQVLSVVWGSDGSVTQRLNGQLRATGSSSSTTCPSQLEISSPASAGSYMDVFEVLAFSAALSDEERANTEWLLARRHHIRGSLNIWTQPWLRLKSEPGDVLKMEGTNPEAAQMKVRKFGPVTTVPPDEWVSRHGPVDADGTRPQWTHFHPEGYAFFDRDSVLPELPDEWTMAWYTVWPYRDSPRYKTTKFMAKDAFHPDAGRGSWRAWAMATYSNQYWGFYGWQHWNHQHMWHTWTRYVCTMKPHSQYCYQTQGSRHGYRIHERSVFGYVGQNVTHMWDSINRVSHAIFLPYAVQYEEALRYINIVQHCHRTPQKPVLGSASGAVTSAFRAVDQRLIVDLNSPTQRTHFTIDGTQPNCGSELAWDIWEKSYQRYANLTGIGRYTIRAISCGCQERQSAEVKVDFDITLAKDRVVEFVDDGVDNTYIRGHVRVRPGMRHSLKWVTFAWDIPTVSLHVVDADLSAAAAAAAAPVHTIATDMTNTGSKEWTLPSSAVLTRGRAFRVRLTTRDDPLVVAYTDPFIMPRVENFALGMPARFEPGTTAEEPASLVVDGFLFHSSTGAYGLPACARSAKALLPTLTVEMGSDDFDVGSVRLFQPDALTDCRRNREGCVNAGLRLRNFDVFVENTVQYSAGARCGGRAHSPDWAATQGVATVQCNKRGKYVTIRANFSDGSASGGSGDRLHLCEVEVFKANQPVCGNGMVDEGEECDDGNLYELDGCTPLCAIERYHMCTGGNTTHRSYCTPAMCDDSCGAVNGVCDDGGPGAVNSYCLYGSDCSDCGKRCAGGDTATALEVNSFNSPAPSRNKLSGRRGDEWAWTATQFSVDRHLATVWRSEVFVREAYGRVHYLWSDSRQRMDLYLGSPLYFSGSNYYYHFGHSVTSFKIMWYKQCGNIDALFIAFTFNLWTNNVKIRRAHTMLNAPYDGVTDLGGWLQVTKFIRLEWEGFQGCVRSFQSFGARIPEMIRGNDKHLEPAKVVDKSGGYIDMSLGDDKGDTCLFQGTQVLTRQCFTDVRNPNVPCGVAPWLAELFPPGQSTVRITGLEADTKYRVYIQSVFWPLQQGKFFFDEMLTFGVSVPAEPTDLVLDELTGGSVALTWVPPDDTGGVPLQGYFMFVGQPLEDWERPVQGDNVTVRLPYGKRTLTLDPSAEEERVAADGVTTVVWAYASVMDSDDPRFRVTGLTERTEYRFRVMSLNLISLCVPDEVFKSLGASQAFTTGPRSPPGKPEVFVTAVSGGLVTLSINSPDDTGGVPISHYRFQVHVPPVLRRQWLLENANVDECARGTHNCDPLQTCHNAMDGFFCGPCPPLHQQHPVAYSRSVPRMQCLSRAAEPLVYNQTFVTSFTPDRLLFVRAKNTAGLSVRCDVQGAESLIRVHMLSDWNDPSVAAAPDANPPVLLHGPAGWQGLRRGMTSCGKYGRLLGGYEILSLGNSITKVFQLPRHRGVEITFALVAIDTHSRMDREAYVPVRLWLDGAKRFDRQVDTAFESVCGAENRKDNYLAGQFVRDLTHTRRSMNLTFDMNTAESHAAYRADDARAYLADEGRLGYFGVQQLDITLIDVPKRIVSSEAAVDVTEHGFHCRLPFNEGSAMPIRALPLPLSLRLTHSGGQPFYVASPSGGITQGSFTISAFGVAPAGTSASSSGGGIAGRALDNVAHVSQAGSACVTTSPSIKPYWQASVGAEPVHVALVRVTTTVEAPDRQVRVTVSGTPCTLHNNGIFTLRGAGMTTNMVCDGGGTVGTKVRVTVVTTVPVPLGLCEVEIIPDNQCAPGCSLASLMDSACQPACNTTLCNWDRGWCLRDPMEGWYLPEHEFVLHHNVKYSRAMGQQLFVYSLPFEDEPLMALTDYRFIFSAVTAYGEGQRVQIAASTSEATVPAAPPIWQAESTKEGSFLRLEWRKPLDLGGMRMTAFLLYNDPKGEGILLPRNLLYNGTTEFTYVRIIELGRRYTYRLMAVNGLGPCKMDDTVPVEVLNLFPGPPQPPPPPELVNRTGGALTVQFRQSPLDGGIPISAYRVYMNDEEEGEYSEVGLYPVSPYVTPGENLLADTVADTNVTNGTTGSNGEEDAPLDSSLALSFLPDIVMGSFNVYALRGQPLVHSTDYYFYATASNDPNEQPEGKTFCLSNSELCGYAKESGGGDKLHTATTAATLPARPPPPTVVSSTGGSLELEWRLPLDLGGKPIRDTTVGYKLPSDSLFIRQRFEHPLRLGWAKGLTALTSYHVAAFATTTHGDGPWGFFRTAVTPAVSRPTAPINLRLAETSSTSLVLKWTEPSDRGGVPPNVLVYYLYLHDPAKALAPSGGCPALDSATLCTVNDAAAVPEVCCQGGEVYQRLQKGNSDGTGTGGALLTVPYFRKLETTKFRAMLLLPKSPYKFVVTAFNVGGESIASNALPAETNSMTGILPPPSIGCLYDNKVDVRWSGIGNIDGLTFTGYRLFLYDAAGALLATRQTTGLDTLHLSWDSDVQAATTYAVRVAVLNKTSGAPAGAPVGQGPRSDPTSFTTVGEGEPTLCIGLRATISSGVPVPGRSTLWHITPYSHYLTGFKKRNWAITLTFSSFHLECDYDSLTVSTHSSHRTIWSGGCLRQQSFSLLGDTKRNVTLNLTADDSFQYSGFTASYVVEETTLPELPDVQYVSYPPAPAMAACPGNPPCSGNEHGTCDMESVCSCGRGWLGEDCSHPLFCTGDGTDHERSRHLCSTLDKLVVVSPDGDDAQAVISDGFVGVQSRGTRKEQATLGSHVVVGKGAKPFRTLSAAVAAVRDRDKIIAVYPGTYGGGLNLQLSPLASPVPVVMEAVLGPRATVLDGGGSARLLHVTHDVHLRLRGFTLTNGRAPSGGALRADSAGAQVTLVECVVHGNAATDSGSGGGGGAVYAHQARVHLLRTTVRHNSAAAGSGGGMYLSATVGGGDSPCTITDSEVQQNTAAMGAGLFLSSAAVAGFTGAPRRSSSSGVGRGGSGAVIQSNNASVHGGNVAAHAGSVQVNLTLAAGAAPRGGGLYLSGGRHSLTALTVRGNDGASSGGGAYLAAGAEAHSHSTTIVGNWAPEGGGLTVADGSSLAGYVPTPVDPAAVATLLQGNKATLRGGSALLRRGGALRGLRIVGGASRDGAGLYVDGGGAASASQLLVERCVAASDGGGLFVTGGASLSLAASTLQQNSAGHAGGGLFVTGGGSADGDGSTMVADNVAGMRGGGAGLWAPATLRGVNVTGCRAPVGGGAYVALIHEVPGGDGRGSRSAAGINATVEGSNFVSNTATGSDGGAVPGTGGGMHVQANIGGTALLLQRVLLERNEAKDRGGGLYSAGPALPNSGSGGGTGGSGSDSDSGCGGALSALDPGRSAQQMELRCLHLTLQDNEAAEGGGAYARRTQLRSWRTVLQRNAATQGSGGGLVTHDSRVAPVGAMQSVAPPLGAASNSSNSSSSALSTLSSTYNLPARATAVEALSSYANRAQAGGGNALLRGTSWWVAVGVQGGNAESGGGGGVAADGGSCSLLQWCGMHGNRAGEAPTLGDGGGLLLRSGSQLTAVNSHVTGNEAGRGGGVFAQAGAHLTLTDCSVTGNGARGSGGSGGGAFLTAATATLTRTALAHNTADAAGGGGWAESGASLRLWHSTVDSNGAPQGSGLRLHASAGALLRSSAVRFNAGQDGGGVLATAAASLTALSSAFLWNTATGGNGGGLKLSTGATALLRDCTVQSNVGKLGGALYGDTGASANLTRCALRENRAMQGGGGAHLEAGAGALMAHCDVVGNRADMNGGGLSVDGARCAVAATAVEGNAAGGDGGGVYSTAGANFSAVAGSSVSGNSADNGGGLYALASHTSLDGSRVAINTAREKGGGLFAARGSVALNGSTVEENEGSDQGGGAHAQDGAALTLSHSRLLRNRAVLGGGLRLRGGASAHANDTEVAGNVASSGGGAHADGATLVLRRSDVRDNRASSRGGGVSARQAVVRLHRCRVEGNAVSGGSGGALHVDLSSLLWLQRSNVSDNSASVGGGCLYVLEARVEIAQSRLRQCVAQTGGGIHVSTKAALSADALFLAHCVASRGGGVAIDGGGAVNLSHSELVGNYASEQGGSLSLRGRAEARVLDSMLKGQAHPLSQDAFGAAAMRRNANFGAAVFAQNSRVLLERCEVRDMNGGASGGVVMSEQSRVTLTDTHMLRVRSDLGGALAAVRDSTLTVWGGSVRRGFALFDGGALLLDKSTASVTGLMISHSVALENGGAVFVGTGCSLQLNGSTLQHCKSAVGGGLYLARRSDVELTNSTLQRNQASSDGGGLHAGSTTSFTAVDCDFAANLALWMGGAVHMNGRAQADVIGSRFTANQAKSYGGGMCVRASAVLRARNHSHFADNHGLFGGGALSLIGKAQATLTDVRLSGNRGNIGGGVLANDDSQLTVTRGTLDGNRAGTHGAGLYFRARSLVNMSGTRLTGNAAPLGRGAGIYSDHTHGPPGVPPAQRHPMIHLSQLQFTGNRAAIGGAFFWEVTYWKGTVSKIIELRCPGCVYSDNTLHDRATRPVQGRLERFPPDGVRSGVRVRGGEGGKQAVRVAALDFYRHVDVLDNSTVCVTRSLGLGDVFFPRAQARQGLASYAQLTLKGDIGLKLTLEVRCVDEQNNVFPLMHQNTTVIACIPGEELTPDKVCKQCPADTYSLRGLTCQPCPRGAVCSRETSIEYQSIGVDDPITKPGYWKFEARRSLADPSMCGPFHDPRCRANAWWDDKQEACLKFEKEYGWTTAIIYACVSDKEIYLCPLGPPSCPGEVFRMLGHDPRHDVLCNEEYTGLKCSDCRLGYFRTAQDTCAKCVGTGDPVVAKVIYGISASISMSFLTFLVCLYLKEDPEPQIRFIKYKLFCCLFDRLDQRRQQRDAKSGNGGLHRSQTEAVDDFLMHHAHGNKAVPLGYQSEKGKAEHRVWLRAEKPKIILINMQLFSQMKAANIIDWPMVVQEYISLFNAAQLDLLKLAAVDCLVRTNFFFSFSFVAAFPFCSMALIMTVNRFGRAMFQRKLDRFPRKCLRCGDDIHETAVLPKRGTLAKGKVAPSDAITPAQEAMAQALKASVFSANKAQSSTAMHGVRVLPSAPPTKLLPHCRLRHDNCPEKQLAAAAKATMVSLNVASFRKRCLKRLNFREFENKMYKLFFWVLLMSYTPVSSKLIKLFKCTEVGKTMYLQADNNIVCNMGGMWGAYVWFGGLPAFVVFVMGIPLLFYNLLSYARTYNVRAIVAQVQGVRTHNGQRNLLKMKLLAEAKMEAETHRKLWRIPDTEDEEEVVLVNYLCSRNMRMHRNVTRLGFIFRFYRADVWWYELVELSRKFWVVAVLYFFAPGTVLQIIITLLCTVGYLGVHSQANPYRRHTDTRLATMAHLQLCVTVFCGLLIKLDVPWLSRTPNFREEQENVLAWLIIFLHSGMLTYGVTSIVLDRMSLVQEHEQETREKMHHAQVLQHMDHFSHKTREVMKALHVKHGKLAAFGATGPGSANAVRRNQEASAQVLAAAAQNADGLKKKHKKRRKKHKGRKTGAGRKSAANAAAAAAAAADAAADAALSSLGTPEGDKEEMSDAEAAVHQLEVMEVQFMETVQSYESGMQRLTDEIEGLQAHLGDGDDSIVLGLVADKNRELDAMFADLSAYAEEFKRKEDAMRAQVKGDTMAAQLKRETES